LIKSKNFKATYNSSKPNEIILVTKNICNRNNTKLVSKLS
jgi:hypothetical protein